MQQKYEEELRQSLKEKPEPKTKLPTARRERPLMLFSFMAIAHNHFLNILRIFDVLTNFRFTTSETVHDYYL